MSRQPSFPPNNSYPGNHRLPSSAHQPRSPPAVMTPDHHGYHRSNSLSHPDHSYQIPYHEQSRDLSSRSDVTRDVTSRPDITRDMTSRGQQGNAPLSDISSPDIPPLFENNVSHLRSSRRGVPPPLDMNPPVQFAPVNVVSPFPSRYGGQVLSFLFLFYLL